MLGEHLQRQLAHHVTLLICKASYATVKGDKILHRHRARGDLNHWSPWKPAALYSWGNTPLFLA